MDFTKFFKTRMRNECSYEGCNVATDWRSSMQEVLADTTIAEWQIYDDKESHQQNLNFTSSTGTNSPYISLGSSSAVIAQATDIDSNTIVIGSDAASINVNTESEIKIAVDTKSISVRLGSINLELSSAKWLCKNCAYIVKMKNLLK